MKLTVNFVAIITLLAITWSGCAVVTRGSEIPDISEKVNFLANPGFETGLDEWTVHVGEAQTIDTDSETVFSGQNSVVLHSPDGARRIVITQRVVVQEGATYELKAMRKNEDVEPTDSAYVRIRFYKERWGSAVASLDLFIRGDAVSTQDWTEITHLIEIPEDIVTISVDPALEGIGTVWWDDIQLYKVDS